MNEEQTNSKMPSCQLVTTICKKFRQPNYIEIMPVFNNNSIVLFWFGHMSYNVQVL